MPGTKNAKPGRGAWRCETVYQAPGDTAIVANLASNGKPNAGPYAAPAAGDKTKSGRDFKSCCIFFEQNPSATIEECVLRVDWQRKGEKGISFADWALTRALQVPSCGHKSALHRKNKPA